MTDTPSFANRWSERKRAVQAEAEEIVDIPAVEAPAEDERTDEEILLEHGLKDPDDMVQGDDFSAFMKSAIPKHLRKRALRKLWTSNPVLACVDGLNDYDGDFTDAANPLTSFKSSYEVGKGYATKLLREAEEKAALESDDSPEVEASIPVDDADEEEFEQNLDQTVTNTTGGSVPPEDEVQLEGEPVFPTRKRMHFEF